VTAARTALATARRTPPGPRGSLLLGNLGALRRDPCGLFLRAAVEHGGLARIRVAHLSAYLVSEPVFIKRVLVDNMRNYVKGVSYQALRHLLGEGLLVADGETWRRQRRIVNPAFARRALVDHVPMMRDVTAALCEQWDERAARGEAFDLVAEMMGLAFQVVGVTLMGAEIADEMAEVAAALPAAGDWIYRHMQAPIRIPPSIPTPANVRFRRVVRALDRVVHRVIAKHRAAGEGAHDMLSMLIAAEDETTGARLSDAELRDQVITFLLAGHETTGSALAWVLALLADHPLVEARVIAELDAITGGRPVTAQHLPALVYLGQVIDEAMRLYPPAWSFTRTALEEDTLGPYRVPRGAMVVVSPWVNHRNPSWWRDPATFDPDRFAPDRAKALETYHYFPFGGGPHMCIGKYLTLYEVKVAVATIAQRFRVTRAERAPIGVEAAVTLRPAGAVPVRAHRRAARPVALHQEAS
jgi:cytochrome P450